VRDTIRRNPEETQAAVMSSPKRRGFRFYEYHTVFCSIDIDSPVRVEGHCLNPGG